MCKKILGFHHSDLDGAGVKVLITKYAKRKNIPCETYTCNYSDVDQIIQDSLQKIPMEKVEEILIGDISVGEETAELLQQWYNLGVKIRLRDHHATAEWLNKYEWAIVREKNEDGVSRCGTWLLAEELDFEDVANSNSIFIETVDSWDTWKWKSEGNKYAKELNALFQMLGMEDFMNYIEPLEFAESPRDLFTAYGQSMIEAHTRQVRKLANSCVSNMYTLDLSLTKKSSTYNTGIVFCNQDISDVSDLILSEHPELDILILIGFPGNISYRTQKKLDTPLGDIAKFMTGSGGGHPQSAGSVISDKQFSKIFTKIFDILSGKSKQLKFVNFGKFIQNEKE